MVRINVLGSLMALALTCTSRPTLGFTPFLTAAAVVAPNGAATGTQEKQVLEPKDVVTRVAVAGATGRVGQKVVEELLDRGVTEVVALVRDSNSAAEVFSQAPDNLQITKCDLSNERELKKGTRNFLGRITVLFILCRSLHGLTNYIPQ